MEIEKKLGTEEGKRIWRYFTRFAEYDDLKDLYNRCIPQISKFEERLIDNAKEQDRLEEIIRRFDEMLL